MQWISEAPFIPVALGLSMIVFRDKWHARIQMGPRSALIWTLAIAILGAYSKI